MIECKICIISGMQNRVVEVVEPKPDWLDRFRDEAILLKGILGETVVAIHHIGSTSVPDLPAKDIIDIILEVTSLNHLDSLNQKLVEAGYEVMGEYGIADRRFFKKGSPNASHHIHAFKVNDPNIKRHLAFRDYLKANKTVRSEYADMKKEAARRCNHDIEVYCKIKDPFIKMYEKTALERL